MSVPFIKPGQTHLDYGVSKISIVVTSKIQQLVQCFLFNYCQLCD